LILVKYSDREKVGENVEQKGIKEGVPEPSYMRECVFMPPPTLSLQGYLKTGCQGSFPLLVTFPSPKRVNVPETIDGSPFLASNGGQSEKSYIIKFDISSIKNCYEVLNPINFE
jgi:hypothetical protein